MDTQKQQIVDRLKQANNILVTVRSNPTVDHLAACIGLTLALNKLGKHATAVFSGEIPSTLEFLQPEKTLEKNTDSLRDFIIALDKSKADKLRYKVEDKVVKIFITPYKTSISDRDLNFSQGDFNVDVVLALGVHQQNDLDQAIIAHGRILHDATVVSVTVDAGPNLGSINWSKPNASSLSELAVEVLDGLDKSLLDGQIATAFLTGIVAETDRFSNNRTSPQTMSISAELMAVGANQQLVATKLAEPVAPPLAPAAEEKAEPSEPAKKKSEDGTLEIEHDEAAKTPQINIDENGSLQGLDQPGESEQPPKEEPQIHDEGILPEPTPAAEESAPKEPELPQIKDVKDESEGVKLPEPPEIPKIKTAHTEAPHMVLNPPTLGGQLSAASSSDFFDPMMDSASGAPPAQPILDREPIGASGKAHDQESPKEEAEHTEVTPEKSAEPTDKAEASSEAEAAPADADAPTQQSPSFQPYEPPTDTTVSPVAAPPTEPAAPEELPDNVAQETLSDIEKQLHSPHATDVVAGPQNAQNAQDAAQDNMPAVAGQPADVSSARDAVAQAVSSTSDQSLTPIQALNAQPLDLGAAATPPGAVATPIAGPTVSPAIIPNTAASFAPDGLTLPGVTGVTDTATSPAGDTPASASEQKQDPNSPPPVPPPMLPPLPGA